MKRSESILLNVAAKHNLSVATILGREKFKHIVAARREAVMLMSAAGMTHSTIAAAVHRERTTVLQYLNAEYAARKNKLRVHGPYKANWTAADMQLFTELYSTVSNKDLASEFGRSRAAVESMAKHLGLRKTKRGRPKKTLRWVGIAAAHRPHFTFGTGT